MCSGDDTASDQILSDRDDSGRCDRCALARFGPTEIRRDNKTAIELFLGEIRALASRMSIGDRAFTGASPRSPAAGSDEETFVMRVSRLGWRRRRRICSQVLNAPRA